MRKYCKIILVIFVIALFTGNASANGYTLPEKMERQLRIGSGLKGSFVIHGNLNSQEYPLLEALQNASFEIRSILNEGNQHSYIYQAGEEDQQKYLTEYCKINGQEFFRSDLLDEKVYQLLTAEEIACEILHTNGDNPSVIPTIVQMAWKQHYSTEGKNTSTAELEKLIEIWISGFSAETNFQSSDDTAPRLALEFKIPINAVYQQISEMAVSLSGNESFMAFLQENLSQEELDIYVNDNLRDFYSEALSHLKMDGDILFKKTVSTMGEPLESSLFLPLDEEKTGYSHLVFQNDQNRKSFTIAGNKGFYSVVLPTDFDIKNSEFEHDVFFYRANVSDKEGKPLDNLALKIHIKKTYNSYEESEDPKTHEITHYSFHAERDLSELPEGITEDSVQEMKDVDADLDLHYSSKPELSSPTTLEFTLNIIQNDQHIDLSGKVKTASPWEFIPFKTEEAVRIKDYDDHARKEPLNRLIEQLNDKIERIPTEIKLPEEQIEQ